MCYGQSTPTYDQGSLNNRFKILWYDASFDLNNYKFGSEFDIFDRNKLS